MIAVYGSESVRAHDQVLIQEFGIPSQQLMEIAGKGCAEAIHRRWARASVAIYCGPGNNGGDGYVIARWLHLWGHDVQIVSAVNPKTDDARANAALCREMGLHTVPVAGPATVLVDALLGTGQSRPPQGAIASAVHSICERGRSGVQVVAIDLPTGLCSGTGMALNQDCVVSADLTLTLGYHKTGLLMLPGSGRVGEVETIDIGLDLAHAKQPDLNQPEAFLLQESDIQSWTPRRAPGDAKWHQGHVAIRAGGGAAVLAAHGAFRSGAGLVTIIAPKHEWADLHGLWPEVILAEEVDSKRHDVLVIGPGLGLENADEVLHHWTQFNGVLVADADALTILAQQAQAPTPGGPRAITPHAAEASRLLGLTRDQVEADRMGAVRSLRKWGVAVLKGPHTLIASADIWINPTGNSALATAGSGDVLAGHIGGFAARGLPLDRAAAVATWRHGSAGERMPENATSSDLVEALR